MLIQASELIAQPGRSGALGQAVVAMRDVLTADGGSEWLAWYAAAGRPYGTFGLTTRRESYTELLDGTLALAMSPAWAEVSATADGLLAGPSESRLYEFLAVFGEPTPPSQFTVVTTSTLSGLQSERAMGWALEVGELARARAVDRRRRRTVRRARRPQSWRPGEHRSGGRRPDRRDLQSLGPHPARRRAGCRLHRPHDTGGDRRPAGGSADVPARRHDPTATAANAAQHLGPSARSPGSTSCGSPSSAVMTRRSARSATRSRNCPAAQLPATVPRRSSLQAKAARPRAPATSSTPWIAPAATACRSSTTTCSRSPRSGPSTSTNPSAPADSSPLLQAAHAAQARCNCNDTRTMVSRHLGRDEIALLRTTAQHDGPSRVVADERDRLRAEATHSVRT